MSHQSVPHSFPRPVDVKQKVPEDTEPRYMEDEGFYVGVKPSVSQRNRNLMEHRLLNRADKVQNTLTPII